MGFWDVVYSAGDRLKGITPDLSTAKRTAFDCTSAAVNKIDQAVRVDGIQKLPQYLPDDETRAQIGVFTTTLAKNTGKYLVYEGFKHIPGLLPIFHCERKDESQPLISVNKYGFYQSLPSHESRQFPFVDRSKPPLLIEMCD